PHTTRTPPLSFHAPLTPPAPPSFPTRRSSDLGRDGSRRLPRRRRRTALRDHRKARRTADGALGHDPGVDARGSGPVLRRARDDADRKSTRLNSSHDQISYAVFCLKKKKNKKTR